MPKGVNAPMVIEMKPHSIVPLSQSRPISEEAPHRYTKKYEGDACDEIFLEAVAKIAERDDHLGDHRIDGSTGSSRSKQKSTKESLPQFLTSAGFGPLMTGARQAAPQNFGTLRLYADPGVRDAPNLVFCINELLFALGGTWRRGSPLNDIDNAGLLSRNWVLPTTLPTTWLRAHQSDYDPAMPRDGAIIFGASRPRLSISLARP